MLPSHSLDPLTESLDFHCRAGGYFGSLEISLVDFQVFRHKGNLYVRCHRRPLPSRPGPRLFVHLTVAEAWHSLAACRPEKLPQRRGSIAVAVWQGSIFCRQCGGRSNQSHFTAIDTEGHVVPCKT